VVQRHYFQSSIGQSKIFHADAPVTTIKFSMQDKRKTFTRQANLQKRRNVWPCVDDAIVEVVAT